MPTFSSHAWYPSTAQQTRSEDYAPNPAPDESGEAGLVLAQTVAWLSPVQIQALSKTGAVTKHVLEGTDEDGEDARLAARQEKRSLSVDEALALIHRLKLGKETNVELAECFEVTPKWVSEFKHRKCYADVWAIWDKENAPAETEATKT